MQFTRSYAFTDTHAANAVTAEASNIPLAIVAASALGLNNFLSPFIVFPYFSFCGFFGQTAKLAWSWPASTPNFGRGRLQCFGACSFTVARISEAEGFCIGYENIPLELKSLA